jgi:hypothetical protein
MRKSVGLYGPSRIVTIFGRVSENSNTKSGRNKTITFIIGALCLGAQNNYFDSIEKLFLNFNVDLAIFCSSSNSSMFYKFIRCSPVYFCGIVVLA